MPNRAGETDGRQPEGANARRRSVSFERMKRSNTKSIGELLEDFFREYPFSGRLKEAEAIESWRELLGPSLADYCRSVRIERGVLYAEISSSVVRSELMMNRDTLAAEINRKIGTALVKKIVLR